MDGLRKLAKAPGALSFRALTRDTFEAVHILPPSCGVPFHRTALGPAQLRSFFRGEPGSSPSGFKMICIPTDSRGSIFMERSDLRGLLDEIRVDGCIEHFIWALLHGYHHWTETCGRRSFHLATSFGRAIWTTRKDGLQFTTDCLFLYNDQYGSPDDLIRYFEHFKDDSLSSLYAPFVFTVNCLRWRERSLETGLEWIRIVESRTGHGSWGSGRIIEDSIDGITHLTTGLGSELNSICNTYKHLTIVKSVWDHLETLFEDMSDGETCDQVRASGRSILWAVDILRQELSNAREQAQFLEQRCRSQTSVLFALLTHEDAKVNIQVANASKDLADAARRDGSSMKTIAILTMAFLPATFFAAFVSIPSLGWDGSDKFAIYWILTIPVTLVTFTLWVVITQRRAVMRVLEAKRKSAEKKKAGAVEEQGVVH